MLKNEPLVGRGEAFDIVRSRPHGHVAAVLGTLQRPAPLLFDDEDKAGAEAARTSAVAPAKVSESAGRKAQRKRTEDGRPVHSFRTLLADKATVTKNRVAPRLPGAEPFELLARPTELQRKAFRLLIVRLQ